MKPWTLNPLVDTACGDTLFQVMCALKCLGKAHADLADLAMLGEATSMGGPGGMTSEEHRGFALLLGCVEAAVAYELRERAAVTRGNP